MYQQTSQSPEERAKVARDNEEMNRSINVESDRELVELAARTVGIIGVWDQRMTGSGIARTGQSARVWNPLDYDEDLLQLVRTLGMSIDYDECAVSKRLVVPAEVVQEWWGGDSGDDKHAVLRAAVVIGRKLRRIEETR